MGTGSLSWLIMTWFGRWKVCTGIRRAAAELLSADGGSTFRGSPWVLVELSMSPYQREVVARPQQKMMGATQLFF